jgi:hypothetical protein
MKRNLQGYEGLAGYRSDRRSSSPPRSALLCEMIFISDEFHRSGVFFVALVNTTAGDPMNKFGTLITSALLTFGIAAGAMAANAPTAATTMAADTPAAGGTGTATATPKPKHKSHSGTSHSGTSHSGTSKSKKPATSATPTTTK